MYGSASSLLLRAEPIASSQAKCIAQVRAEFIAPNRGEDKDQEDKDKDKEDKDKEIRIKIRKIRIKIRKIKISKIRIKIRKVKIRKIKIRVLVKDYSLR